MATPHVAGVAALLANQDIAIHKSAKLLSQLLIKLVVQVRTGKTVESMHIKRYNTLSNYKKIKRLKTLICRSTIHAG